MLKFFCSKFKVQGFGFKVQDFEQLTAYRLLLLKPLQMYSFFVNKQLYF